jgi:hypothetical protein
LPRTSRPVRPESEHAGSTGLRPRCQAGSPVAFLEKNDDAPAFGGQHQTTGLFFNSPNCPDRQRDRNRSLGKPTSKCRLIATIAYAPSVLWKSTLADRRRKWRRHHALRCAAASACSGSRRPSYADQE